MGPRFARTALSPAVPRSHLAVDITCPACAGRHTKHVLLRRVRRHIEQLNSPVRVSIRSLCPGCGAPLRTRVRIDMSGRMRAPVQTEQLAR